MKLLDNKNAVITGARRGIGREIVNTFAKHGANIWACARKYDENFEADMKSIAAQYGVEIWPVYFDVTSESEVKKAIAEIRAMKLPVDVLVNAAGIADSSTLFQMTSIEKMRNVMEVNFFALTRLTQYISRMMAKQKAGSIVNISSVAGIDGEPAQYEYSASKAAVIGGTRNLARELANSNIRVNAIAPGMISTDMGNQIEQSLKEEILQKTIMKRMGRPEEVANAAVFLASDLSSFMTGQIIRVDGGM